MNMNLLRVMFLSLLITGCATGSVKKAVIWETDTIPRQYELLGPISLREEVSESTEDTIGGIADFMSKDGRVSDRIPADMKAALESKRLKYKEMVFDKLGTKARNEYDADAVIGVDYRYIPPFVSFSRKAVIIAEGDMVKYK